MLSVANKPIVPSLTMLSAVMQSAFILSAVMLNIVAP
jgi:hypothetical protein